MFHLHYDTELARLADAMAALLARPDPEHLLQPQTVLVPQAGLQRWLVQRLAEKHGIAANLEFIAPAQLVWRMLRAANPELPTTSLFEREVLRWRLLGLLRGDNLPPVLAELVGKEAETLRSFELAGHLAQLYERYQGYRRELLDGWEHGAERDDPQAELWRRLTAADEPSRSRLLGDFLARHVPSGAQPPPDVPSRLFAFGIVNVSPDVLRVLGIVGRHAELHFFMPTPCREYWGDVPDRHDLKARLGEFGGSAFDEAPNPLLMSLGGVGRDFVAQLFAYDEVQPDFESDPDGTEPPRDTLLHRLQADVIALAPPDPALRLKVPDPRDRSLHVHACHSPLREVQVLHDQLLDMLQEDEDLEPRHIAVMVPNLARYAPCVEAVFGALGRDDPRRIPWTVADRPASETHAVVALFLSLLDLPSARLTAAEVLEVLAVPAVSRRHGLGDADLERLGEWVYKAGIRWGEDAEDRVAHGVPAFEEFSWRFGRRRLLLGYMAGEAAADQLLDGVAPLTDIEGGEVAALGVLFALQRQLLRLRDALRIERSPDAWLALFNEALDELLAIPEGRDEERALEAIREALKAMAGQAATADFADAIDWTTLRAFLHEQLRDSAPQQRFMAGGVSVCGLVPLRNVPFKVICVLGLDADSFPRRDSADALNRVHADRLANRRKPGDRSVRDDDRYLFLQTLMAARDTLYLSYTGIDMRDGKSREPSVVLSELLDVVCEGYFANAKEARKHLLTQHPMQAFSRRLFEADAEHPQVFTYRHEWQDAAQAGGVRVEPPFADVEWPVSEPGAVVELASLRRFFRNPAAMFLQSQVRLSLGEDAQATDLREPLVLDGLQQYQLDHALVRKARFSDAALSGALDELRAQGLLPPLDWGRVEFERTVQAIEPALEAWRSWRQARVALPGHRFRLDLGEGRVLQGVLDDLHEGAYAGWVRHANSGKDLMSWWIGALVAVALDEKTVCVAFGRNRKGSLWELPCRADMPTAADAREHLRELLDMYAQGQSAALPLPPRTAFAYAIAADPQNPDKALADARSAWDGGFNGYGESTDRWLALAFRGRELFDDSVLQKQFAALASRAYVPMCKALNEGSTP